MWDWQIEGPISKSLHQNSCLDLYILSFLCPHWRRNTRQWKTLFQRQVSNRLRGSGRKDIDNRGKIPAQKSFRKLWIFILSCFVAVKFRICRVFSLCIIFLYTQSEQLCVISFPHFLFSYAFPPFPSL
jgi:hypothetical protein